MDSKLLAELKRIVQEDPTLLRRNASQEVLGLLQSRMKSSSSPMGLSVPDALVTSLRENPLSKASRKAPPGKNILMNGKVTLPDPGAHRYWQVMEIPESEGAKGVVLLYARMFPHIEYNAGGNTDLYFALLPYAVRTDLGGTWMITSEPYTIGAVSVWDDGAGTTAVWSNGATTGKSQPLVVRRDDVDGKYYLTIHCQTLNYNDPVVVDYHVRRWMLPTSEQRLSRLIRPLLVGWTWAVLWSWFQRILGSQHPRPLQADYAISMYGRWCDVEALRGVYNLHWSPEGRLW